MGISLIGQDAGNQELELYATYAGTSRKLHVIFGSSYYFAPETDSLFDLGQGRDRHEHIDTLFNDWPCNR